MFSKILKYLKTTRFKTTLWYSFVFLLLELVIGVVIYAYLNHSLRSELDSDLEEQANMIYNFVENSNIDLVNFQPDSVYSSTAELIYDLIFEAVAFNPSNTFVQVKYDNRVFFHTANLEDHQINFNNPQSNQTYLFTFSDSLLSKHKIRAASLKMKGYDIIVAFPDYAIMQTLNHLTDLYIMIMPLFFIFSLIGGSIISFRALHRIDSIIKKTEQITTENLDEIIEGGNYDDEYGRLVDTMNKMIKRIKISIEYMNQFSIDVSHELKTPLTILRGELELALRSEKTPVQYREILESNYEETLRLINIIERLFYLSKLENSNIEIDKSPVEIASLFSPIIKSFNNLAAEKKMKLILKCEEKEKFLINIDQNLFKQVISNLIDNAIKFGRESTEITITCRKIDNELALIKISNISESIPEKSLSKLFDRFYRAEFSRNRNMGGIGLGLSIVKSIIDLHKAKINVEGTTEGKITFTITI